MLRTKRALAALTLFAVVTLFATAAHAGWLIKQKQGQGPAGQMEMITYFGDEAIRTEQPGSNMAIIINLKTNRMYMLIHHKKAYIEVDIDQMNKAMDAQRKMMGKEEKSDVKITIDKTKKKETINGFPCQKVVVKDNGQPIADLWVSKKLSDPELMKTYRKMQEVGGPEGQGPNTSLAQAVKQIAEIGFPVKIVYHNKKGQTQESVVTEAKKKAFDAKQFTPPKGYTKTTMQELMQGMGQGPGAPNAPMSPAQPTKPAQPGDMKLKLQ